MAITCPCYLDDYLVLPLEPARLILDADGTPFSEVYGDVYHSADGGYAQSCHVFLAGNGLPARWQRKKRFVILETGFGLGLNFLATWLEWLNDPLRCDELQFVSVEKHPFRVDDLVRAHAAWPELSIVAAELHRCWPALVPGFHQLKLAERRLTLTLGFGEAAKLLSWLEAPVDAFYLDGFSPARNPKLWSPEICRSLARLAVPGATLATWSVAGEVRRALSDANFVVHKLPGFSSKRQMLVGRYCGAEADLD
jgi:tRNA 5-methylaminomethyl-2-thiouridine biosynthesis bifunctional protein